MSKVKFVGEMELNEEAREARRQKIIGSVLMSVALLMAAMFLFCAYTDRAELQFLFSKPVAQSGGAASVTASAAPGGAVARDR